jgi:hypothetical protein
MPALPLPRGPVVPAGGDLPVVRDEDVLAVLPAFVRQSDTAPVRDALVAALTEILLRYQELAGYAAAQCDIARATGVYLDGLCEDRGVYRQPGETDEQLRARALTTPELVTPAAILAAANTILAPYTTIEAQLAESILDRWYVQDGSATWHSFVDANPQYLKRLYPEDAARNDGFVRPGSRIGGAWAFSDRIGRYFVLRVPVLTGLGNAHGFVPQAFVFGGGHRRGWFLFRDPSSALSVYQAISSAVNRVKGHSVRWLLLADPSLRA